MNIDEVYIISELVWIVAGRFEIPEALAAVIMEQCAVKQERREHKYGEDVQGDDRSLHQDRSRHHSPPSQNHSHPHNSHRKQRPHQDDSTHHNGHGSHRSQDAQRSHRRHLSPRPSVADIPGNVAPDGPKLALLADTFGFNDFEKLVHACDLMDPHEQAGLPFYKISTLFTETTKHLPDFLNTRREQRKSERHPEGCDHNLPTRSCNGFLGAMEFSILMEQLYRALPKSGDLRSPLQMCLGLLQHVHRAVDDAAMAQDHESPKNVGASRISAWH